MALLASCWLIIEDSVIPHGFHKWLYLSYYIHPFLLVFCQFFLWLNLLKKWILFFVFPFVLVFFPLSCFVLGSIGRFFVVLFSSFGDREVYYDAKEPDHDDDDEISLQDYVCGDIVVVSCNKIVGSVDECRVHNILDSCEDEDGGKVDDWLNEYLYSDYYTTRVMSEYEFDNIAVLLPDLDSSTVDATNSFRFSCTDQVSVDGHSIKVLQETAIIDSNHEEQDHHHQLLEMLSPSDHSTDPPPESDSPDSSFDFNDFLSNSHQSSTDQQNKPSKQAIKTKDDDHSPHNIDPFHQKYTSRMKFFNVLSHERQHGMKAIRNERPTIDNEESTTEAARQFVMWNRMARKRILRSLEQDLELIYVAQPCLFWEALHHQHQKVEAIATSEDHNSGKLRLFEGSILGKFQELQILMERFVEQQRCECQRSSMDTHQRLSFQALLHVPDATESLVLMEQEEEDKMVIEREDIKANQVLEAINDCIEAFLLYVRTDDKKSVPWTYKGFWRTNNPPVEDPLDLEILYSVTRTLHKKGILLKDVQGKNKCWLRKKVKPMQTEDEKRDLIFAMIDMKLVQRLLKMSLISTSHLKWCQDKLNNLDFKEGRVFRGRIDLLFPSS